MYTPSSPSPPAFPRPSKVLIGIMLGLVCLWVAFAAGMNWSRDEGVAQAFHALAGTDAALANGEVWRFVTALVIHSPQSPWHLLSVLLVLYFFVTPLEPRWGKRRVYLLFVGAGVFAYLVQLLVGWIFTPLAQPVWFGALAASEALVVAWALAAPPGERVRLFFVFPVSARGLIVFGVVMAAANLLARNAMAEGFVAPFAGMLAGYLGSDRSPIRRLWLKLKLRRIEREFASIREEQAAHPKPSRRPGVIRDAADEHDDDAAAPGRDKPWLH